VTRHFVTGIAALVLAASALQADFSYQEKTAITGGMAAAAMKVAGVFSKQAREPVVSTVSVKGDRLARHSNYQISIVDLANQTITDINIQKKTYSVMTFEEMKQMAEQASQKMKQKDVNVNFKVSANATGQTRQIGGLDTRELVVKMQAESTDQSSGQSGSMAINMDIWLAPSVPGYQEVREFHRRMAEKLDWTPGSEAAMGRSDVAKGMAEAAKEMSKLDGVPVYQTTSISGQGQPGAAGSGSASQPPPQQDQQQQSARPSLAGALGGRFGLGRKKQDDTSNSPSSGGNPPGAGSLMESTTELSGFSSGPVDDAQFAIPAGFKKVEPAQKRGGAQ